MSIRYVYTPMDKPPFYKEEPVGFKWNGGFAVSQKQKNIHAIHEGFKEQFPDKNVLEISSASIQGGKVLSAFFLEKYVPSLGISIPVENLYQAGKVFENGGPYLDLLTVQPIKAKRDERLQTSGKLIGYTLEGMNFPLYPQTLFYNFLYMNALLEHPEKATLLHDYDGFKDIAFNPKKGINCQARAAASFCALAKLELLGAILEFSNFKSLYVD